MIDHTALRAETPFDKPCRSERLARQGVRLGRAPAARVLKMVVPLVAMACLSLVWQAGAADLGPGAGGHQAVQKAL